jgi:hypothetical protein
MDIVKKKFYFNLSSEGARRPLVAATGSAQVGNSLQSLSFWEIKCAAQQSTWIGDGDAWVRPTSDIL